MPTEESSSISMAIELVLKIYCGELSEEATLNEYMAPSSVRCVGMIQERSAGAIVFYYSHEDPEYLLLNYTAGHWDFPKGNIEKGEKIETTVRREVKEETGITDIVFVPGFSKKIEYYYMRGGKLVHKVVTFYLARAFGKKVTISSEHLGYTWLDYKKALEKVTFRNAKEILKEAHRFLKSSISAGSLDVFLQQRKRDQALG